MMADLRAMGGLPVQREIRVERSRGGKMASHIKYVYSMRVATIQAWRAPPVYAVRLANPRLRLSWATRPSFLLFCCHNAPPCFVERHSFGERPPSRGRCIIEASANDWIQL